ncbi:sugar transferase [Streptomyces sp. NPDC059785]|uniref:sugar transferase n=1 Tax=Streptomyces sp. NPDC059785 TaxID=3346945 RepID=UPI00364A012A
MTAESTVPSPGGQPREQGLSPVSVIPPREAADGFRLDGAGRRAPVRRAARLPLPAVDAGAALTAALLCAPVQHRVLPAGLLPAGLLPAGLLLVVVLGLNARASLYRPTDAPAVPAALDELPAVCGRIAVGWCALAALLAAFFPADALSARNLVPGILLQSAVSCLGREAVHGWRRRALVRRPSAALVAGPAATARRVAAAFLRHPDCGVRPVGVVDRQAAEGDGLPVLTTGEEVQRAVIQNGVRTVLVVGPRAEDTPLLRALAESGCRLWMVDAGPPLADGGFGPAGSDFGPAGSSFGPAGGGFDPAGGGFDPASAGPVGAGPVVAGPVVAGPVGAGAVGAGLVGAGPYGLPGRQRLAGFACRPVAAAGVPGGAGKRALDVLVSGALLLTVSPLLLVCAVVLRLGDGPGVVFRQERVGKDGRPFTLLKFRTHRPADAHEAATRWSVANEHEMRPFCRFLRRTSLDELLQLWNVFRGDMSLVGPRPERPYFVTQFSQTYPGYAARHRMRTGITGLAQVHGLRGDTSIEDRCRFDNAYIDDWSLWQDVRILLRTAVTLLRPTGS